MKILHYYWTQADDSNHKGGGIKTYIKNIIPFQFSSGHDVYLLNSGIDYSFLNTKCRVVASGLFKGCKKFSILNSPVLAPSKANFSNIEAYLNDYTLKATFNNFLEEYGPFDVIHFHSLEGLSLPVLELKKKYPRTRFIYSVHNYFLFCPQVNLWKNDEGNCLSSSTQLNCSCCLGKLPSSESIKKYYALITLMEKYGFQNSVSRIVANARKVKSYMQRKSESSYYDEFSSKYDNRIFNEFRIKNIEYINKYMDQVLCVSKRVQEICAQMGIQESLLSTLYIGTDVANKQLNHPQYDIYSNPFQIAYMGYMRKDKGFYFLLDALEVMDEKFAANIKLVLAAKNDDESCIKRIEKLKTKFSSIEYFDGYTHENIDEILKETQLGIVPVMWEDNLPQVAMEFKAKGIPVLTSDLGGANELSPSEYFRFKSGEINDFLKHLKAIYSDRELLRDYYNNSLELQTIKSHSNELMKFYE